MANNKTEHTVNMKIVKIDTSYSTNEDGEYFTFSVYTSDLENPSACKKISCIIDTRPYDYEGSIFYYKMSNNNVIQILFIDQLDLIKNAFINKTLKSINQDHKIVKNNVNEFEYAKKMKNEYSERLQKRIVPEDETPSGREYLESEIKHFEQIKFEYATEHIIEFLMSDGSSFQFVLYEVFNSSYPHSTDIIEYNIQEPLDDASCYNKYGLFCSYMPTNIEH